MRDNHKFIHRAEFSGIGRVLGVVAGDTSVAIIVCRKDNAKVLRSKKFYDYNEAMAYYSALYSELKSTEEYETMRCMLESLIFIPGDEPRMKA